MFETLFDGCCMACKLTHQKSFQEFKTRTFTKIFGNFSLLKRSCIFPGVLGQILTTSNDRLSNISVICRPGHADTCQHCPISWLTTSCVFVFALALAFVFVYLVVDTCQPCRISWLTSACIFVRRVLKVLRSQSKVTMHKHQRRRHQPAVKIAPKDKNCTDQWQAASAICAGRRSQIQTDFPDFGWCRVKWLVNWLI